jgi:carbon monoxide dehydrogenase subunit G
MGIEKRYTLDQSLEQILMIFQDLKRYALVHPLIRGVELLESNELGSKYLIIEQPYAYLPFRVKYQVVVLSEGNEITYTISGLPWTDAQIQYSFESNVLEGKTAINFKLKIEGKLPNWGHKVLQHKMMKAQDQLMEAIAKEQVAY